MKTIDTLIPDIQTLVKTRGWLNDTNAQSFATGVVSRIQGQFSERTEAPRLRLSQMGPRCPKALWHSIHQPENAEVLPHWAEVKYSLGHLTEALAIEFARGAGHEVTGEQDELTLDDIVGHRDCIIDGCTVDVKSAASISFTKFKSGVFDDLFGYLDQLDSYVLAAADDPLVKVKDKGYLLIVDKQLGHMHLYPHEVTNDRERVLRERIRSYKYIVSLAEPPPCECRSIPAGAAGNMQLDTKASYSSYKYCCHPHLRTFLYAHGPAYFTKVVKRPFNQNGPITEVDRNGKVVYN